MTIELKCSRRHIEGKKVKQLRTKGITPLHLFGPGVASEAIQCDTPALKRVLAEAGRTQLITLHLGHEKNPRTVMVREIQTNTFKDELLHVDFYQVKLTEKIKVNVPLRLTGESAAAKTKGNTLVQELNELTIECLPTAIPSSIPVDITPIITASEMIRVKDIQLPAEIAIINDPGVVIARIAVEKIEVPVAKPAVEGEVAPEEGEEAPEDKKEATEKAEKEE